MRTKKTKCRYLCLPISTQVEKQLVVDEISEMTKPEIIQKIMLERIKTLQAINFILEKRIYSDFLNYCQIQKTHKNEKFSNSND